MMLIPYVYYPGTAGEAFDFYVKTLGGKIGAFFKYNAGPSGPMSPGPEFGEKAMHACYQGPGITLFATDLARFVREGELRGLFKDRPVFNLLGGEPEQPLDNGK